MTKKLITYDPAENLSSDESIATFMTEAFETNDAAYVAHAFGVVARAKGMPQIAVKRVFPANSFTALSAKMEIQP